VEFVKYGARLIGGCCGTTPDYIRALKERISALQPAPVQEERNVVITSSVRIAEPEKLTGRNTGRLDASQDADFLGELIKGELSGIDDIALDLASEGYDAVYVNADRAEGSPDLLAAVVDHLQWYIKAPLIIETKSPAALEKALRIYRGVAGVSLGNACGCEEGLKAAVAKYGSVIVPAVLPDR
jgi:5-methyltetrahydrofolate--homocysteine methyltransferase